MLLATEQQLQFILAGELLKKAEELIDKNIHRRIIVSGYRKSSEKILEELKKLGLKLT